jgi:RNA polymerase sigma-70 factor, ECF subfamily
MAKHSGDMDDTNLMALVEAARAGDQQAFLTLAETVQPTIRATLAACAIHPSLVDELVHETLISAWKHLDQYRGQIGGGFPAWVRTIARNHLRKALRGRRQGQTLDRIEAVVIDHQLDRLEEEDARRLERLRRCLARLSEPVRRLVEGHHLRGESVADLALAADRTANWVAVALFRARKALAGCMDQEVGHGS